jgi:hypothetical protein
MVGGNLLLATLRPLLSGQKPIITKYFPTHLISISHKHPRKSKRWLVLSKHSNKTFFGVLEYIWLVIIAGQT